MAPHLRPATEADLGSIVDVSTAAFDPSTDAIASRLFPPNPQTPDNGDVEAMRQRRITRKSARFHAKRAVMTVAVDDALDGKVVGYAIWQAPFAAGDVEEPQQPPPPYSGVDQAAYKELHEILEKDVAENFGERGTKDVWQLNSFGVDPPYQRRGIGRMLLDWGVQEATKQGKDCYLVATPAGVAIYRAAGFEEVKTMDIFGAPHVSMRRTCSK